MSNSFIPTSCPTDRGDRLRAVRRLMCQQFSRCLISMMLQACLLLQQLPLFQEVIYKFFSYSLLFFCYIFIRTPRGWVCLYCPHVLGGREACLGGGCRLRCFFAWAGKFLHCFRGGAVGGGVTPYIPHYNKWDKKVQIQGLRRRKNRSLLIGK